MAPAADPGEISQRLVQKLEKGCDAEAVAAELIAANPREIPAELICLCIGDRARGTTSSPKALRVLLEGRADPNASDPRMGSPLLHYACYFGTVETVRALLDARADMEAHDPRMKTPALNTALAAGNAPACLELLNRNADVMWQHDDGATALHVAMAWITSEHNNHMRLPPVGEEPRAVIAMMLHNGVDPTKTEGMTRSTTRGTGMTPLESFRRQIASSPWRQHESIGQKFFKMSEEIHKILEQGEQAVKLKDMGNAAYKEKRYEDSLKHYADARKIWATANVRGHHSAVLWSNEALVYEKLEDWVRCVYACDEGLKHYCTAALRKKLESRRVDADKQLEDFEKGVIKEPPPKPQVERKPPTKLARGWAEQDDAIKYPEEGSHQGKVDKPGPFICHFEDAKEAGFVDGVDGEKDRKKREEQRIDRELVAQGLMSPDLLDDPRTVDYINRLPPHEG